MKSAFFVKSEVVKCVYSVLFLAFGIFALANPVSAAVSGYADITGSAADFSDNNYVYETQDDCLYVSPGDVCVRTVSAFKGTYPDTSDNKTNSTSAWGWPELTGWDLTPLESFGASAYWYRFTVSEYVGPGSWTDLETVYVQLNFDGASWTASTTYTSYTETQIIDLLPEQDTENPLPCSTDVHFALTAFIAPGDIGDGFSIKIYLQNIDQNGLLGSSGFSPSQFILFNGVATTSGMFYFSEDRPVGDGNYRIFAELNKSYVASGLIISNPISLTEVSNQFIVCDETFIGHISQQSYSQYQSILGSTTATSTNALARSCNPILGWDTSSCLAYLFIPDAGMLFDTIKNFRDRVATHFPLGYVTDFLRILSTTTTSAIPVINATLPGGVGGSGSNFSFSLTASTTAWFWNSTVGDFANESAPDTRTLFEIVSDYWNPVVYFLLVLYILRRILGAHVIPEFQHFGASGSLSDNGSNDDSYKLKEWLYKRK